MSKPRWLLDVDGVINAVTHEPPNPITTPTGWHDWKVATVMGYTITYAQELVDFIAEMHESGKVDIEWLTTWEDGDAVHLFLEPELGLPHLPIIGRERDHRGKFSDYSHWWKFEIVKILHAADPERFIIWTDDDINFMPKAYEFVQQNPTTIRAIAPNTEIGLTKVHADIIRNEIKAANETNV